MNSYKILFLLSIFSLAACHSDRVYKAYESDFPFNRWEKSRVLTFNPEISDTASNYSVSLELRHVYGFQFETMKVRVDIISPSGEAIVKHYTFQVMKNKEEYFSDCAGSFCDLRAVVEPGIKFKETGVYTFKISHELSVELLPNVMEFGLIIDKNE
jgi:gliding motility-associated lipoprotein GldH